MVVYKKNHQFALVCLLLAGITLFAYWDVSRAGFTNYDDQQYVTGNREIQSGLTQAGILWAFSTGYACNWHPLTWLSHMLDWQLYGAKAGGHHLTNLIFHAFNTLLLFSLLRWMTGALWRSAIVAALFAWHPVHVESVAWVAERKDVLSTFFWLLTMLAYVFYARRPGWLRYTAIILLFILGLLSKPMVVTLPVILLLLDIWPLRRIASKQSDIKLAEESATVSCPPVSWNRLILEKIPLLFLAGLSCLITLKVQIGGGAVTLSDLSLTTRLINAFVSYLRYIGKIIWPQNLAVFYPYETAWPLWQVAVALLMMLGIGFLAIRNVRRHSFFLTGWLWYLVTLVPVIGLVQVGEQSMADRYTYIPSIGFFILLVWGIPVVLAGLPHQKWILGTTAIVILVGCIACTRVQVTYWKNSIALFTHALAVTPSNAIAHYNLGQALSAQGDFDQAEKHYIAALQLNPKSEKAHNNLGLILALRGKPQEATNHYAEAIKFNPGNEEAHLNYGIALATLGQWDEAVIQYHQALALDSKDAMTHYHLGRALLAQNRLEEADAQFSESLRLDPNQADALYDYGLLLNQEGKLDEAGAYFSNILKLKPEDAPAHAQLAGVLATQGRTIEAINHYHEALRGNPDMVPALNNLAWILAVNSDASLRNGTEAVQLARHACDLTQNQQVFLLGTLAAALAEAGRFSEAVTTAVKARELALTVNQKELARKNEQLLQLYRSGRPYHEGDSVLEKNSSPK